MLCCSATVACAQDMAALDAMAGKALFERTWVTAPASTTAADGLGPYYDARSCAACHPAAGTGAVPDTLVLVTDDPVYGRQLQRRAVAGLPAEAVINFTAVPVGEAATNRHGDKPALQRWNADISGLQHGPLSSGFSLRRPPALAGVARFAEVSDSTLQQLADAADEDGDGISGRVAGRYGWKADVDTMERQIARAFAVDMGLGNPLFPAAAGDCTPVQTACLQHPANTSSGAPLEVEQVVLDLVGAYLARLAGPAPAEADAEGKRVFSALGCAACHVAELPTSAEPLRAWTDLLLHDMGPGLAVLTPDSETNAASTLAEPVIDGPATASEWRTAPLWGLGQRQHYLHDGRASTIEQAILWHGGEAAASRQKFAQASEQQRRRLQAFLLGL